MRIIRIDANAADRLAPLLAEFRVTLRAYKNIQSQADIESGKEEILYFLKSSYPVFAAEDDGVFVDYIVCRIAEPCLWVEHLFVSQEHRRKGIATMLFSKAQEIAGLMGEDTVYNYVHPNNENMIRFLSSQGYTVLNMIEIRKPYRGETLTGTIRVENDVFDY